MTGIAARRIFWGCVVFMMGISLHACAMFSFKPAKEVLEARVCAMMDAKINDDWGKVYEFFDPSYKEKKPRDAFIRINRQSRVVSYTIESIDMSPEEDAATVKVIYSAEAMSFKFDGIVNTQQWRKRGWTWYFQADQTSQKPF